jgi:tetratricopeptide (TPR) repeat protein
MERRYEGFLATNGLYILDTFTGEVKFIEHSQNNILNPVYENKLTNSSNLQPTNILEFTPFENEVISSYPYLIARPFYDLLNEKDSRMKCKLMVDTFTAVLKYLALQLASEYLRAPEVKDIQVHQTLTKDLSRPLISAWNLLIARCLPVLKDNRVTLFSPELKNAYEKLETKCKDPFLVTQHYSDENGETKTKTKKLGKIQALINYRNGLAHGFNQSQARAQKEFNEYYPILCDILQEIRFVSRYTLWHVESNKDGVNGIRLMGSSPLMKKIEFDRKGVNPSISPLFLINDTSGEILPLYAFFDVDHTNEVGLTETGKDVFVFEGNTKNSVIYLSSNGEHLEKTTRFNHWKELLAQKQIEVSWINEKSLTIDTLHSIGVFISTAGIHALVSSGKYLREATIARNDLNEFLDSFSYSIFNGFVLGGESGIGKSTLLAQKTEEWQKNGHMVSFYRGSALNQSDLANKFLRDCALKINYFEDFLSIASPLFKNNDKKCYLVVDALNEFAGDLNELIKSIESIVAQSAYFPWFKMVVSIRDSAYNRTSSKFGELSPQQYFTVEEEKGGEKVKTNIIRLQPLSKDFVEQLYNAYRDFKWKDAYSEDTEGYYKFRPITKFQELNNEGSTIELLRSPLMARLIMQSFHRSKLPDYLTNDEAMRLYLNNIILEKSDEYQGFPERKKLLSLIVLELDKQNSERIDRDHLLNIPSTRAYLINNQKDSPYIQLLDLGVLMEEWENENCYVRFSFDKLLEFMLAELHWPRIHNELDLLKICKRAVSFRILQGATEIIIIRFCLNKQPELMINLIDKIENETEPVKSLVRDLSVGILFDLAVEHKDLFYKVIELLPQNPSQMDLEILQQLIDKLYLRGNLAEFDFVMKLAVNEAQILNNLKILSNLLLYSAQLDIIQGRYMAAREKLENALQQKDKISDNYGRILCKRKFGDLEQREGNLEFSTKILKEALDESITFEFDELTGALLKDLGGMYRILGRVEDAEKLLLKSVEINRELCYKKGLSYSLNSLGLLLMDQGKIVSAEKCYMESLLLCRDLGDKIGLFNTLNSLGLLLLNQDKFDESEKLFMESLGIGRSFGAKRGISVSTNNLGALYLKMGRMDEAEKYILESIEIKKELGSKKGISISLNHLGDIYRVKGNFSESERYYLETIEIKRSLGNKRGISVSLISLGILQIELNNRESAKKYFIECIELQKELKDVNLLPTIHKAFSLFDNQEREFFLKMALEINSSEFVNKERLWKESLLLMQDCLKESLIEPEVTSTKYEQITNLVKESKITFPYDLPIETFILVSTKLIEQSEFELAQQFTNKANEWVGNHRTIYKEKMDKILNILKQADFNYK